MSSIDDELRARFSELRAEESAAAPGLSTVLNRARPESRPSPRRRTATLLVGAAASIVGITLVVRQVRLEAAARQSVTAWRSPTTSLMPTTPHSVLAPPPLLSSVLDGATASTLWRKGD